MPIRLPRYTVHGVGPDGSTEAEFQIENAYVDHLKESGQFDKWRATLAVADVLGKPMAIFRGLNRPGTSSPFDKGLAYCGKPKEIHDEHYNVIDPPEGFVLAVYAITKEDDRSLGVFDWDWKEEDPSKPGFPIAWESDFGELLWPTNQAS